jgi:Uma2 family endonuclease
MSTIARMTLDEYEKMPPQESVNGFSLRTELIRGELRTMNPIGAPHADIVDCLAQWSQALPGEQIRVRIQQPLRIATLESEPLPDVVWVAQGQYRKRHPAPEDVLLIIEVADSSLAYDRGEKAELYAAAGIADYWVVNIVDELVEVMREPVGGKFSSVETYGAGASVTPLRYPEITLSVDMLFPREGE